MAKANAEATNARCIHTALTAWAQDHDQEFPTAQQYSNEAFRELFKVHLLEGGSGERVFGIPGDAWHNTSASGEGPDGKIGAPPEFSQALERGECAWSYVSGLETCSRADLPLIANGFTESLGVYTDTKSSKGGVLSGEHAVYVTVGGSAKVASLSSDYRIVDKQDIKTVDVFSKEWGTNPDDIKNPF